MSVFDGKFTHMMRNLRSFSMNYKACEDKLNSFIHIDIIGDLTPIAFRKHRIDVLRKNLENFYPDAFNLNIIHVTGSKGKGSTCLYLERLLRARGFNTGLYISPHLVTPRERIQINGKPVDESEFTHLFEHIDSNFDRSLFKPSYLIFLYLMALYKFVQTKVDYAIIEVGIGGLYDYTNIFDKNTASIITSIELEHTEYLGNTLSSIAHHKSGIIKRKCPVFTNSFSDADVCNVIQGVAQSNESELIINNHNASQVMEKNFLLARKVANYLTKHDLNEELNDQDKEIYDLCKFPGRLQKFTLNEDKTIFCDVAHTKYSLQFLGKWFHDQTEDSEANRILIYSLTGERNLDLILNLNLKHFHKIFIVNLIDVWKMTRYFEEFKDLVEKDDRFLPFLNKINFYEKGQRSVFNDLIENKLHLSHVKVNYLVTGSYYLVKELLQKLIDENNLKLESLYSDVGERMN